MSKTVKATDAAREQAKTLVERIAELEEKTFAVEAENARLKEEMVSQQAVPVNPLDQGIAGRVALTRLLEQDWPDFKRAVRLMPYIYKTRGFAAAMMYAQTSIRARLDALNLRAPRTASLVQAQHRVHMFLDEGQVEMMFLPADDPSPLRARAGLRARMEFLMVVSRYYLGLSYRAAFERGVETPAGLLPTTFGGMRSE